MPWRVRDVGAGQQVVDESVGDTGHGQQNGARPPGRAAGAAGSPSLLAGDAGTGLLAFSAGTGQLRPCMLAFVDHRGHQRTDEEHGGGVVDPDQRDHHGPG
ncbi:hypothetical protein G6F31_020390 [Rhizopus arrhizus]|nr:hypothetical protein G6F31_020390 [Rhizopus arrhizus]